MSPKSDFQTGGRWPVAGGRWQASHHFVKRTHFGTPTSTWELWRLPSLTCGDTTLPPVCTLVSEFREHPTNQGMFMKEHAECS